MQFLRTIAPALFAAAALVTLPGCESDTSTDDILFELDNTESEWASVHTRLPFDGGERIPDPDRHIGEPCDDSALADGCECAQWGSWSGLQYEVCTTECVVDADCVVPGFSCVGGKCLQRCEDVKCAADSVCIAPFGVPICAHHV